MGTYLSFDSKFSRTLIPVLFKPGFLTNEYREGRRAMYIPPIRLFVFVSIIFFLILAVLPDGDGIGIHINGLEDNSAQASDTLLAAQDSLGTSEIALEANTDVDSIYLFNKAYPLYDTYEEYLKYRNQADEKPSFIADIVLQQAYKINSDDPEDVKNGLKKKFFSLLPKLIFLVMPFFALILKLLYIRRKYYYEEHFIFALHFHTFAYLSLLLLFLVSIVLPIAKAIFPLIATVYLFMAMRKVYAQGFWKTLIKISILMLTYFLVLAAGVALSAIYTALTY
jgi:hypothetical protein